MKVVWKGIGWTVASQDGRAMLLLWAAVLPTPTPPTKAGKIKAAS